MEIITTVLLAVVLLKIGSIVQAIRWLKNSGARYAECLRRERPQNEADYYSALEDSGGRHFPFGIKDYLLQRYISLGREKSGLSYAAVTAAAAFHGTLYRYERLAGIAGLWAVIMASVQSDAQPFMSHTAHAFLLYALTIFILGTNLLLSVEAVFSYATLGSYATSFHMLTGGAPLLRELRVVVGKVATTVLSGAVAAYVAYVCFCGLEGKVLIATPISGTKEAVGVFLQMVYWSMTTFATVGYGDIVPANGYGQVVAFLIEVQAFAILAIVFASLFGSREPPT